MTDADLQALSGTDAEVGSHFSALELSVVHYAEAMTADSALVDDGLFARLREHFDEAQIVELTSAIAWENYRARFNRALEVAAEGYSEGAFCPLPQRALPAAP